mmetsp:Transcript_1735/g.4544  ORF Transcript_1735/g.4544 Transcript_1735/m.4544 type:complete len:320 (+) Transcript_1735:108-1067(+)
MSKSDTCPQLDQRQPTCGPDLVHGLPARLLVVRERREGPLAQAVELLAEQVDLLRLHLDERLELALHVHVVHALARVLGRVTAARRLDMCDDLTLRDGGLERVDLVVQPVELVVLLRLEPLHLGLLPLALGHALLVRLAHRIELSLELRHLGGLPLLAAALHQLLQVLGHAQQLELACALDEVVALHGQALVVPDQLGDALAEVAHLLQDLHLLAAQLLDLKVERLYGAAVHEERVGEVGHHGGLLHLELPLLELERHGHVPDRLVFGLAERIEFVPERLDGVLHALVLRLQLVHVELHGLEVLLALGHLLLLDDLVRA